MQYSNNSQKSEHRHGQRPQSVNHNHNQNSDRILLAKVIEYKKKEGDEEGKREHVILKNVEDGKIGFIRNGEEDIWREKVKKEGERFYVKLDYASKVRYEEYRYWVGLIIGMPGKSQ